ncbi:hypothetical protein IKF12_03200 [Candidatus Saccharibacteria bacterium]|nr:hypothetical protein [Candidatus Saccharibacteria bacterium]
MKKNNNKGNSTATMVKCTAWLTIFFLLLVGLFFVGDWLDLAGNLNIHFRFDWTATACAFLSAIASIFLASVSVIQNKKAEEANERLAKINKDQLEASIIGNNYPIIKFRDQQRIENRNGRKEFVFRFFDTRGVPLKEAFIRNVVVVPLKGEFENEKKRREIVLQKKEISTLLQFTFLHDDSQTGFYMVRVPTIELFDGYRYCRIELEMDLVSTTGVVSRCKYYVLLDGDDGIYKQLNKRIYPHVYHQFFENKAIISEQKYLKEKTNRFGSKKPLDNHSGL